MKTRDFRATRSKAPTAKPRKKLLIIVVAIIVALVALVVILELTNTTHIFHKAKPTYETQPADVNRTSTETKGETGASASGSSTPSGSSSSSSSSAQAGDSKTNATNPDTTTANLLAPTGTFVSNHHPNLSGSPAPNTMTSGCNTSPGATCQIIFTQGSTVKSLPAQAVDRGGSAYWSWKLQDIGLVEGSWTVQAKAVLGSQTKTANDATELIVQP